MKSRFPPSPGAATDQFLRLCVSLTGCAIFYCSGPQPFWHQEPISWKTIFPWTSRGMVSGWFKRFMFIVSCISEGFPWWLRWWRICLECRRPGFDPWVRKIPWRRKWLPTLVFLPGEFHGQRSQAPMVPMGQQSQTRPSDYHFQFTHLQPNAATDRTGDTSPWPRGWGPLLYWANSMLLELTLFLNLPLQAMLLWTSLCICLC